MNVQTIVDLVYVYTNSKVLTMSKEKDEKKSYHDNVDSKDWDGPISKNEDDMQVNNDIHIINDGIEDADVEMFGSLFCGNEDYGGNGVDENDFPFDEDHDEVHEGILAIAWFCDGNEYIRSENVVLL